MNEEKQIEELKTKLHLAEEAFRVASENAESARDRARSIAREIFEEIEVETELYDRYEPISTLVDFLAELKKKYTGEKQ